MRVNPFISVNTQPQIITQNAIAGLKKKKMVLKKTKSIQWGTFLPPNVQIYPRKKRVNCSSVRIIITIKSQHSKQRNKPQTNYNYSIK